MNHSSSHGAETTDPKQLFKLMLGCIGVVYGDIGTSPLYAMRESLHHVAQNGITQYDVLGVTSLLIWALILVVTLKYVVLLMRADNNGEGGMLSLMALARRALGRKNKVIMALGVVGASMFYGDAMITPAISVLSAVEGLKLVTPVFDPYVIPITLVILIALFMVQSRGTGNMAAWFGPLTLIWFGCMAVAGVPHILENSDVWQAFSPHLGVLFFMNHAGVGMAVLGSVFLAVTGAEALYADMGHFGAKPIQKTWLWMVLPALLINYLGQAAFILNTPSAVKNPFFLMVPEWALVPMVVLATIATVIASQAVITGAFSLTRQAIQLGFLPRLEIRHTSETQAGQIYLPQVNTFLLIGVLFLVVMFKDSSSLAAAYGIAVTADMVITSCLAFMVMRYVWRWKMSMALLVAVPMLTVDVSFLTANAMKIFDGGYVPVLMAIAMMVVIGTWIRGTRILTERTSRDSVPLKDVMEMLKMSQPVRVPGTAIFLTNDPRVAPTSLMHNLKHNKVLHQNNVILTVRTEATPRVVPEEQLEWSEIDEDFSKLILRVGYMETPNIPELLVKCRKLGLKFDIMSTSFFLGRRTIKADPQNRMPLWQDNLYILLARNATNATDFFQIPMGRVVEMGTQVQL